LAQAWRDGVRHFRHDDWGDSRFSARLYDSGVRCPDNPNSVSVAEFVRSLPHYLQYLPRQG
jgi:hypothetical protein